MELKAVNVPERSMSPLTYSVALPEKLNTLLTVRDESQYVPPGSVVDEFTT